MQFKVQVEGIHTNAMVRNQIGEASVRVHVCVELA